MIHHTHSHRLDLQPLVLSFGVSVHAADCDHVSALWLCWLYALHLYACAWFVFILLFKPGLYAHLHKKWIELFLVFWGTGRKVAAALRELSCLWFWNWLCRNPPRLKSSYCPCGRNEEKKKNIKDRETVWEKQGNRERERQRLVYSRGRSFLFYESHF